MKYIGITERGDAGLNFDWVDKMDSVEMAILITKNPNPSFIKQVLKFKDKVIVHVTCTGMGGSIIEPNVLIPDIVYYNTKRLIDLGFPKEQIVLRVDPIIPTKKGIKTALNIMKKFIALEIPRMRFSFLDMYSHVKERFLFAGINNPYESFNAPFSMINEALNEISKYQHIYQIECCAEENQFKHPCISQRDVDILKKSINLVGSANQRKGCGCPTNKKELLTKRKQCPYKCLYCYWK